MEKITESQIEKGLQILKSLQNGKFISHANSCVHCGLCGESCMYYLTEKKSKFLPAQKVDLITSIYKKYFTFTGKTFPKLVNARELDEKTVNEMIDLFF